MKKRQDIKYSNEKGYKNRLERFSYCHKYIGEKIIGYEDLLLPINEMRDRNKLTLFN